MKRKVHWVNTHLDLGGNTQVPPLGVELYLLQYSEFCIVLWWKVKEVSQGNASGMFDGL